MILWDDSPRDYPLNDGGDVLRAALAYRGPCPLADELLDRFGNLVGAYLARPTHDVPVPASKHAGNKLDNRET